MSCATTWPPSAARHTSQRRRQLQATSWLHSWLAWKGWPFMLFVDERDGGASTSAVSCLIDNRLVIETVQLVQRAVLGHQSVYGHLGAGCSAGLIFRYCITSGEPAAEQCYPVATWDVRERRPYIPTVNEERHACPVMAISHHRFTFKMVGHSARLRVDADKRRGLRVGFVGLQARSSVPPACTGDKGRSACLWQLHQVATTLLRRRNMRFPDELKVNILRQICGIAGIARPVP